MKTDSHEFGPEKMCAKRANDLCKMLVTIQAAHGGPKGPREEVY
jgi:hypothetical protein